MLGLALDSPVIYYLGVSKGAELVAMQEFFVPECLSPDANVFLFQKCLVLVC